MKKIIFLFTVIILFTADFAFANRVMCVKWGGKWFCEYQEGDCDKLDGMSPNKKFFCKQLMINPNTPPIIRTDIKGNAFLDNAGQILKIASDNAVLFFKKKTNPTTKEIETFYKIDNGVVSQKRLLVIAKSLNTTIIKSDKPIVAKYCPACDVEEIEIAPAFDTKATLETKTNISNISSTSCFCCGSYFNIPKPVINVPVKINCTEPTTFTTTPCEGANVFWNLTPSIPNVTQTPTSFTIPANSPSGDYTLTLSAACNRENIIRTNYEFKIDVNDINCKPDFLVSVEQLPNGTVKISTNPLMQTLGQEHWWAINYDGTYPICNKVPIPFDGISSNFGGYITASGELIPWSGTGIAIVNSYGITYSGFPVSSCIRVTHYVKCCGEIKGYSAFFSLEPLSNNKNQNPTKPILLNPKITYK